MSIFKIMSSAIIGSLIIGYFIYPNPEIKPVDPIQLPWHITIDEQQNTSVFNIKFNIDTLKQSMAKLGTPEEMALYADPEKPSIEVYFGKITKAGLAAKVILSLQISKPQAEAFLQRSTMRMQTVENIPKIEISAKDRAKTLDFTVTSLTYTPQYSGLEQDYLLDRFGKPDYFLSLSETATQFFYKDKGLSVISDRKGKELFQYTHPSLLIIPEAAKAFEQ